MRDFAREFDGLPRIIADPPLVRVALGVLGVSLDGLQDVAEAIWWAHNSCTENDPPSFPGWQRYAVGTRSVRELLMPEGWDKDDSNGYCRTISPDQSVAIVVCAGNEETGNPDREPTTRNPKGPHTIRAVAVNRAQLELFQETQAGAIRRLWRLDPPPATWLLLTDVREGRLFAELSMPSQMDESLRVHQWERRIILPWPTDASPRPTRRFRADDIDIEILRRAS